MKKFLLLSAVAATALCGYSQDYLNATYYVIGSNVNGHSWECGVESCKMENKGGGIHEWTGEYIENGFKFNDGSWSDIDLGGSNDPLVLGENYSIYSSGANIKFAEADGVAFSGLKNPKIVLNVADPDNMYITVTGEKDGIIKWYFAGTFNTYQNGENTDWCITDEQGAYAFTELGDKKYELKNIHIFPDESTGYAEFKVASTGWGTQYGAGDSDIVFGAGVDEGLLEEVGAFGGGAICYYDGYYDINWDGNTHIISFKEVGGEDDPGAVNEINAANGEATYYNLQGVRVANPENGLFIQALNGKATKVLIRK